MSPLIDSIRNLLGRGKGPDRNALAREVRYVVVDTELTGIDEKRDSIISIGCIGMFGGRIEFGDTFSMLVAPRSRLKPESVIVHGITPAEVDEQPAIGIALEKFLDFCKDDILVGHCIAIDLGFLNREMRRVFGAPIRNPAVDTYSLFEFLQRRLPMSGLSGAHKKEFRLYDIAKNFGIPIKGGHNALMDAFTAAQLFQRFLPLLHDLGIDRVEELIRVGDPNRGGDIFRSSGEVCNM